MTIHRVTITIADGGKIDAHIAALQVIRDSVEMSGYHRQIIDDTLSVFEGIQRALSAPQTGRN